MGIPVTVFRNSDAGAPQIPNGKPSEVINVLKKCLEEGYGSKPPIGWTLEFEDAATFKAVFRNNLAAGGSGGAFQIYSSDGTDANNKALWFRSAQSITALDTFIKPSYRHCIAAPNGWTDWLLVGNGTAFWLFIGFPSSNMGGNNVCYENAMFAGDFESTTPSDNSRFIALADPYQSGDTSLTYASSWSVVFQRIFRSASIGNSNYSILLYGTDGDAGEMKYSLALMYSYVTTSPFTPASHIAGLFNRVMVWGTSLSSNNYGQICPDGTPQLFSDKWPGTRGFLPGLVVEMVPRHTGSESYPLIESVDGQQCQALRQGHYAICAWLKLEQW